MPDNPIFQPDHFVSDEDVLSDLYKQNASATALGTIVRGTIELSELTGDPLPAGIDKKGLAALRRIQATTYRLIEIMEGYRKGLPIPVGAAETSPEVSEDATKGVPTTKPVNEPQKPAQAPVQDELEFDLGSFDDLFGDDE